MHAFARATTHENVTNRASFSLQSKVDLTPSSAEKAEEKS